MSAFTTNQVKNAAGTEVEFTERERNGRKIVFAQVNESPVYPHRITFSHEEVGAGLTLRERSLCRVEFTNDAHDIVSPQAKHIAYIVLEKPLGRVANLDDSKKALAMLSSLCFTTDGSTFVANGTGTGAALLLAGSLPA